MSVKNRNYFAGFSFLSGYQYGRYRSKEGDRSRPYKLAFSGNDASYGRTLPIVYGRARVADPVLLIAKPEGDFLTTLWAVSEGVLGTNPADNTQSGTAGSPATAYTPNFAYCATYDPAGNRVENIFVNGESRHDPRPGFGIQVSNGDQDRPEPASAFFPTDPTDFITNHLAYWGTGWVCFRINTKSNPSVDLNAGSVTGTFEVQFGRIHRNYTSSSSYVLRATDDGVNVGANPSMVELDLLTAKRAGAGEDFDRINTQSFVDFASHCSELVTNVFDGTQVKRWTFNGIFDQTRSLGDWLNVTALAAYSLPPYIDKDGLIAVRALKSEDLSSVPLFSSKVADTRGRNIIWQNGASSLVKSRRPMTEVPNEVRVSYIDKSTDPQYVAVLTANINSSTDPVSVHVHWSAAAVASGTYFRKDDKIQIDSEQMWITLDPGPPDGSDNQVLHCQRAYNSTQKAAHGTSARVQFVGTGYAKITVSIADRDAQDAYGDALGDQSRKVISKSYDFPGTTTADEAARAATLILRAGEFGQGGLDNNEIVTFLAGYRDAEDLAIGDVIEVEDDLLDPTDGEQYYRVTALQKMRQPLPQGGIAFFTQITAVLHDNAIYDDTANTVADFTRVNQPGAFDGAPDPVTNFAIAELGVFDANNKPQTTLEFDYVEPSPLGNFRSVLIYRSSDDGSGSTNSPPTSGAPVGDWRLITELLESGQTIPYPVSGEYEWFCAVSRPLTGHTPDVDTLDAAGDPLYPRLAVFVDGVTDALPAPSGVTFIGTTTFVSIKWDPYTGNNLKLFKEFHIYRNTINDFSSATLIDSEVGTIWLDTTTTSATSYYYWITGFSILHVEGTPTTALHVTSPSGGTADSGTPDAPIIDTTGDLGSSSNSFRWLVLVESPGSPANWNQIAKTTIEVTTDPTFATFPSGVSLQVERAGPPPEDVEFVTNYPGTYHFRAKVTNTFGDSAWSTPIARNTSVFTNATPDTGIPPAPDNLAIVTGTPFAGNEFGGSFDIPTLNTASYNGLSIFWYNSSTLPTATKDYSSYAHAGVSATLVPGSAVLQVAGSPGFTVNQWAGKEIVVFATSRGGGSPLTVSFDYEGQMFILPIVSNTSNTITLDIVPQRMIWDLSGLGFYIVTPGLNHHFWEKIELNGFATPFEADSMQNSNSRHRSFTARSNIHQLWLFASVYNLYGLSPVTTSPPNAVFAGITSNEIGAGAVQIGNMAPNSVGSTQIIDGNVIASKLTASSMGFSSSIVFSASSNTVVAWGSGTIKTADGTSYSITSGNTGTMAAFTYIYFDPSVSTTALQHTTSATTATGEHVILLCVAQNTSDSSQSAFFDPAVGLLGINQTVISDNAISTSKIQALAITTGLLNANAVTAAKIDTSTLSAINISAFNISGQNIIGAVIKTASSGGRVEIDSTNGFVGYSSGGVAITQIDTVNGYIFTTRVQGTSGTLNLRDSSTNSVINLNSSNIQIFTIGTLRATFDSSGVTLPTGHSFVVQNGYGVGTATETWAFSTTPKIEGFLGGAGPYVRFDTTSSSTASNMYLWYDGSLTQVRVFDDGLGHKILYF